MLKMRAFADTGGAYDAIARDYLVYEGPGLTPLCALRRPWL